MSINYSLDEAVSSIENFIRCDTIEDEIGYKFTLEYIEPKSLYISKNELQQILNQIRDFTPGPLNCLYNKRSLEMAIREESRFMLFRRKGEPIVIENDDQSLRYILDAPTVHYMLWYIIKIGDEGIDTHQSRIYIRRRMRSILGDSEEQSLNVMNVLRHSESRLKTIQLQSKNDMKLTQQEQALHSFVYHLSYNTDKAFVPYDAIEDTTTRDKRIRFRKFSMESIDAPRRSYNIESVQYYLRAVSAESPVVSYLSYYHIVEYYFDKVFNENLINEVQTILVNPSFSYKRKTDIKRLINTVVKSHQFDSQGSDFSELLALRLCLAKYVDIERLISEIKEYDELLIDYYQFEEVPFSGGSKLDFDPTTDDDFFKSAAQRIYKTRNSLVHSKDNHKYKLNPFHDDHKLILEIPLLKFIAEMVIENESEIR